MNDKKLPVFQSSREYNYYRELPPTQPLPLPPSPLAGPERLQFVFFFYFLLSRINEEKLIVKYSCISGVERKNMKSSTKRNKFSIFFSFTKISIKNLKNVTRVRQNIQSFLEFISIKQMIRKPDQINAQKIIRGLRV